MEVCIVRIILEKIADSFSYILNSKAQDSGFHKQNFPGASLRIKPFLVIHGR